MDYTQEWKQILAKYREDVGKLQQKKRFLDGMFGLGNHPGNDACHDALDQAAEALCGRAAAEGDPASVSALTKEILQAQASWDGPEYAALMLAAVQRHTMNLIPGLSREDRAEIREWYEKHYPRRKRLPVQEQLLKSLKAE